MLDKDRLMEQEKRAKNRVVYTSTSKIRQENAGVEEVDSPFVHTGVQDSDGCWVNKDRERCEGRGRRCDAGHRDMPQTI